MTDPTDETPRDETDQPGAVEAQSEDSPPTPPESGEGYALADASEAWKTADDDWQRITPMQSIHSQTAEAEERLAKSKSKSSRISGELRTLVLCNLIVFVSSVCIMVLELVASRLIAKHVGSSLYTWTSVIGVVLAGITVGNFIGGWLADRFKHIHRKLLAWLFLLASVTSFSVLWLDRILAGRSRPDSVDWPMWVFLTVAEMFFLPALVLGTISPVVASIALRKRRNTGVTVGNVYAWGALGSIVGTFLTGFYLIDAFGTRLIIGGTAAVLAFLGLAMATRQLIYRTAVACGWLQFLAFTTAAATVNAETLADMGQSVGELIAESNADVVELEEFHDGSWSQKLDRGACNRLLKLIKADEVEGLSEDAFISLEQWLRGGGYRKQLNQDRIAAIETLIAAKKVDPETVENWRLHGEQLGLAIHQVGLLMYLRDDLTGEYHDESNYSYVNVHETFEDEDMVRELRLDKLVHSYFNPSDPTKLYYEYEKVYAEVTHRVASKWERETRSGLDPFPRRDRIERKLPGWVSYDDESKSLIAHGVIDADRREELLLLSEYGEYWLAIEKLAADTRQEYWGGLSSVPLETLPPGLSNEKFLIDRLTYSPTFQTLDAFRELSSQDVETLCSLGDAKKEIGWLRAVNGLSFGSQSVDAFFIGGGGFVFPRWLEAEYSGESRIDVAELDPAVLKAVQLHMGLPPDDQTVIRTYIGDARNVVDDLLTVSRDTDDNPAPPRYDFIYGDAFNDFSVPWHLTTREFNEKVRELLKPDAGVYLMNIIDIWPRTRIQGSYRPVTTDSTANAFPAILEVDPDMLTDWQYPPAGYGGLEVLPLTNGESKFSVRGVMPQALRDRLLKSAQGAAMQNFRDAVSTAFEASRSLQTGRFFGSCLATLAEVFPNVYVFSTSLGPPSDTRDTFVIVASLQPIDLYAVESTGFHWSTPPFASREKHGDGTETTAGQWSSLIETSRGLILTDDYAPVDNLLRPVFEDQD